MYFLIDFENVSTSGLKGVEYLLPTDHVSLFYSDVCANCAGSYLRNIGNHIALLKLLNYFVRVRTVWISI